MNKLLESVIFVVIFLMILSSGCAPASTPIPPSPTFTLISHTDTPVPTNTPIPTATQQPPTATPKPEPALYVLSKNGNVTRVSLTGATTNILDGVSGYCLQLLAYTLYVCNQKHTEILVYDLEGKLVKTVPIPSDVNFLEFTILPDGRFALFSNYDDKVYFIDSTGKLLASANILDIQDNHAQNLNAIVVDNSLILSENGKKHVVAFDLNTYERTTFKDLSELPGAWLGAITYDGEAFYLATSDTIYKFTETTDARTVAKLPEGNITGIVIVDGIAYVSVNFTGEIYKVDMTDGTASVLISGLDNPNKLVLTD